MPNRRSFLLGAASLPLTTLAPSLSLASGGRTFDIFGITGQSNATGYAPLGSSPVVTNPSIECFVPPLVQGQQTNPPYLKPLADPVQQNQMQPLVGGSMWPAFANEYFRLTGRAVCICGGARDGQGLTHAWRLDEPYVNRLVRKVNYARDLITSQGDTGIFRGVLWVGGEQDAKSGVTAPAWESAFSTFLARLRVAFVWPDLPLFCISIDRSLFPEQDAAYGQIRSAQYNAARRNAGIAMVTDYANFAGRGMIVNDVAQVHWNQTALNSVGVAAARRLAAQYPATTVAS